MNTNEYLDLTIKTLGLPSDYALANALGVTRGTVSNYRMGRSKMNTDTALKIAALLNLHPALVMAHAAEERAQTPEEVAVWQEVARKFAPAGFVQNAQRKKIASA